MMHDKISMPGMKAPHIKGHMKIQLHDAETGELTQEIELDNYVAEQWFEAVEMWERFTFGGVNAPQTNAFSESRRRPWYSNSSSVRGNIPFPGLYITDYSGAIDTSQRVPRGNLVGASCRGYSVTDAGVRGSYNPSESEHTLGYHRFVYDFSTAQGNGSIQSIYTGEFKTFSTIHPNEVGLDQTQHHYTSNTEDAGYFRESAYDPVSGATLALYVQASSSQGGGHQFVCYRSLDDVVMDDGHPPTFVGFGGNDVNGMATVGTDLYFLGEIDDSNSPTRTLELRKVPWTSVISELDSEGSLVDLPGTVVKTYNDAELTSIFGIPQSNSYGSALKGMEHDSDLGTIYVGGYPADAIAGNLFELDPATGAHVATYTPSALATSSDASVASLKKVPEEADMFYSGGAIWHLDRTAGTFGPEVFFVRTESNVTTYGTPLLIGKHIGRFMGSPESTSYNARYTPFWSTQHFFSRVRLDAPVVKDNTNTMKIVYEFTIDRPDIFA